MGITFPLWSPTLGDVPPSLLNQAFGSGGIANTSITTAGNGTLTAAAMVGGQIARTGPTAAYTDTTDTAANIVTALGSFDSGATFVVRLRNSTVWPQTIAAGTGVTWSLVTVIPPWSVGTFFGTVGGTQSAPTVVFRNTSVTESYAAGANPIATALTTVGSGTITAAGFAGTVTLRSGATSAFTDTTDTADAIIAAAVADTTAIGSSFLYTYVNNSVALATLTGGTGVTVSGVTSVQPNSWAQYLVTYTAASTLTVVGITQGYFPANGTFTANGATPVTVSNARVTATSQIDVTLKTVGGTVDVARPNVVTITPGTGFNVVAAASDTSVYNYSIRG